jgi:hypothetical protein
VLFQKFEVTRPAGVLALSDRDAVATEGRIDMERPVKST